MLGAGLQVRSGSQRWAPPCCFTRALSRRTWRRAPALPGCIGPSGPTPVKAQCWVRELGTPAGTLRAVLGSLLHTLL